MMNAEQKQQQSPWMLKNSIETEVDSQYLCQFIMLLMDTVEELTTRTSQIDFVCRQHFPDLQALSQSIQKKIIGFDKAEELEWRKKEDSLLQQIHELQSERQLSQDQFKQLNASLEESNENLKNKERLLNRCQLEKKDLLGQIVQKVNEAVRAKELEEDLQKLVDMKNKKIEEELSKRKILFEDCNKLKTNYKVLKSQYNFLISKLDNGMRNSSPTDIKEGEKEAPTGFLTKRCNEDMKNNIQEASKLRKLTNDVAYKKNCVADNTGSPKSSSETTSSTSKSTKQGLIPGKPPLDIKKKSLDSKRLAASGWRGTRALKELRDGDPHDDFLDTPMENVRNINLHPQEVNDNNSSCTEKCMKSDCSDEETPGIKPETSKKCPISIFGPSNKGYKYVEPVRKKVEREKLKGVECQHCKKFYDAVLPDGGNAAANSTMRCEHHDGVSRHRYKYAPPLTPEGFWNIGFDSDL